MIDNVNSFFGFVFMSFVWCIFVVWLFWFGHQSKMELVWSLSTTNFSTMKQLSNFGDFFFV
jgi:hypothetical protein